MAWASKRIRFVDFIVPPAFFKELFGFIDVHPRRVGGRKRDKPVWEMAAALRPGVFTLVAVGARGARDEIRHYLATHDRVEGKDFLCVA